MKDKKKEILTPNIKRWSPILFLLTSILGIGTVEISKFNSTINDKEEFFNFFLEALKEKGISLRFQVEERYQFEGEERVRIPSINLSNSEIDISFPEFFSEDVQNRRGLANFILSNEILNMDIIFSREITELDIFYEDFSKITPISMYQSFEISPLSYKDIPIQSNLNILYNGSAYTLANLGEDDMEIISRETLTLSQNSYFDISSVLNGGLNRLDIEELKAFANFILENPFYLNYENDLQNNYIIPIVRYLYMLKSTSVEFDEG